MTAQTTSNQRTRTASRRQTMEQKRGRQAWDNIMFIRTVSQKRDNDALQKEYRTRASQLNAMIQINGLGQTLGFLKSKKEQSKGRPSSPPNAYDYLLCHLSQWTSGLFPFDDPGSPSATSVPQNYDSLLNWIMYEAGSAEYRRATTECLAFGTWLRRFAEAELKSADSAQSVTSAETEARGDTV